ncbi:hypothetical protein ABW19_dt0204147 [Dactylella cylindrospora]|nr:hypothetical protein ABW19_dt0204147 [Dactylella cylindrospora]
MLNVKSFPFIALLTAITLSHPTLANNDTNFAQYVNVFIGTESKGNVFPGPCRPFGVVKLGPDVTTSPPQDAYAGYLPYGNITAFTTLHTSGMGGAPKYGVVGQMPLILDGAAGRNGGGSLVEEVESIVNMGRMGVGRDRKDEGGVGWYTSHLLNGIGVDLAATEHVGMIQYTFPTIANESTTQMVSQTNRNTKGYVLIDLSHVLTSHRPYGWQQNYRRGNISVNVNTGRYEGSAGYDGGWNGSPEWTVYFCGKFNRWGTWTLFREGDRFEAFGGEAVDHRGYVTVTGGDGDKVGVVYTFDSDDTGNTELKVTSRIGVSFVSVEKACGYIRKEIPDGRTIERVRSDTRELWNREVLGKVKVKESNRTNLELLYSSLYSMHIMPSNRTGENPLWNDDKPYYDDIVTQWDRYKTLDPLLHVLQPDYAINSVRSQLSIFAHEGWLTTSRLSNYNGRVQGGTHTGLLIADVFLKPRYRKNPLVNWDLAYKALVHDAEAVPGNNHDHLAPDASTIQGRGALPDWTSHGYITKNYTRSVSRAVEYSLDDFAVYKMASTLGGISEAEKYLARSRQWRNHYNHNSSALGFSGFLTPISETGELLDQDPLSCGMCYWADEYYQGIPYEYTFGAYHDIPALIGLSGGPTQFVDKLLALFTEKRPDGFPWYDPGNQVFFTLPYLFNLAGRQDLSVKISREIAKGYYRNTPDGLAGNSDSGSLQSWLLWSMIGLYPLTGTNVYLIGSPWFEEMEIALGDERTFIVTSTIEDGGSREDSIYVQSLRVNGVEWRKSWVSWTDVFEDGGKMEFVLGREPKYWAEENIPPGLASQDAGSGYTPSMLSNTRDEDVGEISEAPRGKVQIWSILIVAFCLSIFWEFGI